MNENEQTPIGYDNYNNPIWHKFNTDYFIYELVQDNFSGWYVNQIPTIGKTEILAKFYTQDAGIIALLFWNSLKSAYNVK